MSKSFKLAAALFVGLLALPSAHLLAQQTFNTTIYPE
jgi:hypothetical protein